MTQCGGRRTQGGAGGDHVVDDDHPVALEAGASDEFGSVKALDTCTAGLGDCGARPREQPSTRHTELAGDVPGHQLALIEAACTPPCVAGGRPGHDIDATLVAADDDGVDDQPGEVAGDLAPVAILEPEYHLRAPVP